MRMSSPIRPPGPNTGGPGEATTTVRAVGQLPPGWQQRVVATRQAIRQAAVDRFLADGYADTAVAQIAADACVTERTVFRHFPTKPELVLDRGGEQWEPCVSVLRARPASEPLAESIAQSFRQFLPAASAAEEEYRVLRLIAATPELRAWWATTLDDAIRPLAEGIADRCARDPADLAVIAAAHFVVSAHRVAAERWFDRIVVAGVADVDHAGELAAFSATETDLLRLLGAGIDTLAMTD